MAVYATPRQDKTDEYVVTQRAVLLYNAVLALAGFGLVLYKTLKRKELTK